MAIYYELLSPTKYFFFYSTLHLNGQEDFFYVIKGYLHFFNWKRFRIDPHWLVQVPKNPWVKCTFSVHLKKKSWSPVESDSSNKHRQSVQYSRLTQDPQQSPPSKLQAMLLFASSQKPLPTHSLWLQSPTEKNSKLKSYSWNKQHGSM